MPRKRAWSINPEARITLKKLSKLYYWSMLATIAEIIGVVLCVDNEIADQKAREEDDQEGTEDFRHRDLLLEFLK
jgi:hypothetical protein